MTSRDRVLAALRGGAVGGPPASFWGHVDHRASPAPRPPPRARRPPAAVVLGPRVPPRVAGRRPGGAHARALAPLPLGLGEAQPAEALSRRTVGSALPLHGRAG